MFRTERYRVYYSFELLLIPDLLVQHYIPLSLGQEDFFWYMVHFLSSPSELCCNYTAADWQFPKTSILT